MKRATWITIVDVLSFVSFLFLVATGALLRYVLPPGSGGVAGGGPGWRAASRPVDLVWGLTRHEWGGIHFWISVIFLVAIALHLLIHWKWIVVSFRGRDPGGTRLQAGLGVGALLGLLVLAVALVLGPKETVPRGELRDGLPEAGAVD